MGTPTSTGPDRIPSLDGLRAISIAFVLIGHLAGTSGFPFSAPAGNLLALGELGVHVFFVISGYLITRLLLDELARTDRVSLGRFYLRRTLRIFPPYYALIGVLVAAQSLGWIELARNDATHALTYTSNYAPGRSWFIGHTWSLSVEEQFYLLWPAVVVFAGARRAIVVAAAAVLLGPIVRVGVALCLDWSITFGDGRVGRVLNARPLVFVGVLSYSLYLWQQPFLNRASSALPSSFPLNLALATTAALASYYVIERPSLQVRRLLEGVLLRRRSPSHSYDADVRPAAIASEPST